MSEDRSRVVGRRVVMHARTPLLDGSIRVEDVTVSHTLFGGGESPLYKKRLISRRDSVAVLLHDVARDVVIAVEQFRPATHDALAETTQGWLVELPAGTIDPGEEPQETARREMLEETGYAVGALTPIAWVFASPGASTERLYLYYAEISASDLKHEDPSDLQDDSEDIRRVEIPVADLFRQIAAGEVLDAKLLMAGLWLQARRAVAAAGGGDR